MRMVAAGQASSIPLKRRLYLFRTPRFLLAVYPRLPSLI